MKIVVMDGQGGRMGALLCEKLKKNWKELPDGTLLTAIGTNSAATAAMLQGRGGLRSHRGKPRSGSPAGTPTSSSALLASSRRIR